MHQRRGVEVDEWMVEGLESESGENKWMAKSMNGKIIKNLSATNVLL